MSDATVISNPRRILAVSLEDASQHLSRVVKDLTNSPPEPASTSLAGTTHDLLLKTPYYTATVPIWLDLISSPSEWAESFLSEEAKQVLDVLGGLILVFPVPTTTAPDQIRTLIREVGSVVKDGLGGWEWDGVGLAVGVGEGETDEWEELCAEVGLEFVQIKGSGKDVARNEFGEKTGIARVKEALEANDWAQLDDDPLSDFGDFQESSEKATESDKDAALDPESLEFGFDRADFEGLKAAIWTSGVEPEDHDETKMKTQGEDKTRGEANGDLEEEDVVQVEKMMRKLQAAREAGEGMSEQQRKRMAARAVEEVMKELS